MILWQVKGDINMAYFKSFTSFTEAKLHAKERNQLPDSEFGLPSQRRYPLHDRAHILSAVRLFNKVSPENEEELARNIIRKMEEYNIPKESVGPDNRLRKYL